MTGASIALVAALTLFGPSKAVQDAVERAEAHYLAKEYEEASFAFGEAYSMDPNPVYLYARAQAERLAGRCNVALDLYDRYLATKPPDDAAKEAEINRARCEPSTDEPPPPAPDSQDEPVDEPPPARPWYRDPVGAALVGVGGVTTVIGAGLFGIAISNDRGAEGEPSEADYIVAKDAAQVRYRAGIVLTSIGLATVVAGAIRWAVVAKRGSRKEPGDETVAFSPGGLRVRF